jgi:hypothetical protein
VAEQVVLGADCRIDVGQVDPGALSVYRHATILAGSLACMPEAADHAEDTKGFSPFGVASALLAIVAVVAAALVAFTWTGHRSAQAERSYQARVLQAASQWTSILINMTADNVEASMGRLRDGTVGELNSGFDQSIAPYRDVVKTLRSRTTGEVESVSIEEIHTESDPQAGQGQPTPPPLPPELSSRTDTVLVVATSVSENAGTKAAPPTPGAPAGPITVRWNLRLGVSDIDGTPMISRLESLR